MIALPLLVVAGLDVGHVVDGGVVPDHAATVDAVGVGWVRINMRLDAWSSVDDPAWLAAYDQVIDAYLARGIEIDALINDEAIASTQPHGSDAWIGDYVAAAVKIVDHFKNRVRVYEIINEPNDFAGGTSARFTPSQFAKILQDTYLAVKHDGGHDADRCWQVELISGPLFSFDGTPGDSYLDQTYAAGTSTLAWDYTHQVTGTYPLDGVGYHMYVAQGLASTNADVRTQMLANLDAIDMVVRTYEPAKPIWVTEYGWEASVVGNDIQAQRLTAGFDAMVESAKVSHAFYFDFQDFPGATYGVYDEALQPRPSATALSLLAPLPLRAAIKNVVAPVIAPGQLGDVIVTLENHGTLPWTSEFRLAPGTGCPDSAVLNTVMWEPTDGYATSPTDARVFLPSDVQYGQTVDIHVPVRAPLEAGEYMFAARMVQEGVTLFGPTIQATITVAGTPSDPGDPANPPAMDASCGCGTAHRTDLGIAFALLALRKRRRARR